MGTQSRLLSITDLSAIQKDIMLSCHSDKLSLCVLFDGQGQRRVSKDLAEI